ncbi:MAG: hypothetical protein JWP94_1047 [Mucilaginibacter sp.]|nr:hypothetical protein [Mucilaginibacter sp.]
MKLLLFSIAVIFGLSVAKAQNGWIVYKIDNKLSVKLPSKPIQSNEHSFYVKDESAKDTATYVITYVDFLQTDGMDSVQLAKVAPTYGFADNLKNRLQDQTKKFTIGPVMLDTWNNYICYYMVGVSPSKKSILYAFSVVIGTKVYGLIKISSKNFDMKNDYFFSSLTLN